MTPIFTRQLTNDLLRRGYSMHHVENNKLKRGECVFYFNEDIDTQTIKQFSNELHNEEFRSKKTPDQINANLDDQKIKNEKLQNYKSGIKISLSSSEPTEKLHEF